MTFKAVSFAALFLFAASPAYADCNCACQRDNLQAEQNAKRAEQQMYLTLGRAFQENARDGIKNVRDTRNDVFDLMLNGAELKERQALNLCD